MNTLAELALSKFSTNMQLLWTPVAEAGPHELDTLALTLFKSHTKKLRSGI